MLDSKEWFIHKLNITNSLNYVAASIYDLLFGFRTTWGWIYTIKFSLFCELILEILLYFLFHILSTPWMVPVHVSICFMSVCRSRECVFWLSILLKAMSHLSISQRRWEGWREGPDRRADTAQLLNRNFKISSWQHELTQSGPFPIGWLYTGTAGWLHWQNMWSVSSEQVSDVPIPAFDS